MCSLWFDSCSRPAWRHCTGQFDSRPQIYYFIVRLISTCRSHTHTHSRSDHSYRCTSSWRPSTSSLHRWLEGAAASSGDQVEGLCDGGGGEGEKSHDLRSPAGGSLQPAAGFPPAAEARRGLQPGGKRPRRSGSADAVLPSTFHCTRLDLSQPTSYKILWNVLELCNVSVLIDSLWYRTSESRLRTMRVVTAGNPGLWLCHEALRRTTGQRFPEAASPGWPGGPVWEPAEHLQSVASLSCAAVIRDAVHISQLHFWICLRRRDRDVGGHGGWNRRPAEGRVSDHRGPDRWPRWPWTFSSWQAVKYFFFVASFSFLLSVWEILWVSLCDHIELLDHVRVCGYLTYFSNDFFMY